MRRSPFTLLVCMLFLFGLSWTDALAGDKFIKVIIDPYVPNIENIPPILGSNTIDNPPMEEPVFKQAAVGRPLRRSRPRAVGYSKPIVKVKPNYCPPPPSPCGPAPCILPKRNWGQWEFSAQAFYARTRGKVRWATGQSGFVHPALDFNSDLGLPGHKWLFEYSARYQFRPHWSCFYSIMPIEMDETYQHPNFPGQVFKTKWEYLYQRVGLTYQPIVTCNAVVSIFGTWTFNDQKMTMNSGSHCPLNSTTTVTRTRNMVMAGIEMQNCIRTLCNGATLSCDNRVGVGFLDNTFALDVQAGLRFSVPMGCGRWGYARGGYRFLEFTEDRSDLRFDTSFEGGFAELGLIF